MAKRRTDSNRKSSGRRNFAAWLMTLLPGFMFLGLLAPGAVSVKPKAEESYPPISFRNFAPRRIPAPLYLAHASFESTTIDGSLYSGARYAGESSRYAFDASASGDTQIVLADDDSWKNVYDLPAVSAGDAGDMGLTVDLTQIETFQVIPGMGSSLADSQYDTFHGLGPDHRPRAPTQIPEPTTGTLLGFGLGALALRRRHTA